MFATLWIPAKPAVDNLDVHLDVHLEIALEIHEQVLTQQSPDCLVLTRQSLDCLRPFWIPAKPAVDNIVIILAVGSEPEPGSQPRILAEPARRKIPDQNLNQVPNPGS